MSYSTVVKYSGERGRNDNDLSEVCNKLKEEQH